MKKNNDGKHAALLEISFREKLRIEQTDLQQHLNPLSFTQSTTYTNEQTQAPIFLLLMPFLLVSCSSTFNPSIETEEAIPQLMDEGSTDEFN